MPVLSHIPDMEKPRTQVLIKFFLTLAVLLGYFAYLSYKFDVLTGGVASAITWSFFVLCTPIADAGFLLDFPLRLILGIRMIHSEMVVWLLAFAINFLSLHYAPHYYQTTLLTDLLQRIITTPYPYWGIIVLSALGTFLSIRFGDELMDALHHHERRFFHAHHFKYEIILVIFFLAIVFGYYELIRSLGIESSLLSKS